MAAGRAFTTPEYQNTLPNCSNLVYAAFIHTLVRMVWPPEVSEAHRSPNEPEIVFLGTFPK